MKKFISLMLIVIMCLFMVSCTKVASTEEKNNEESKVKSRENNKYYTFL